MMAIEASERLDKLFILHEDTRHGLQLLAEAVAAMDERIARRFEQIDRRFEQIDRRFEQVDRRFDRLDDRLMKTLSNHERRVTRLEKRPRR
jgi:uncharacterized protein (DUF3084 family)